MRALLLLLLALAGCDRGGGAGGPVSAGLDPDVASFAALERSANEPVAVDWPGTGAFRLARTLKPAALDGVPHARVGLEKFYRADGDYVVEWLRAEKDRVVCAARELGVRTWRLDPPQPLLVAPLREGATWRWDGTVGGQPASADFRVVRRGEKTAPDGSTWQVVEVEQVTRAAGETATRVCTWAAGLGLVLESGVVPPGDMKYEARPPRPGEW